MGVMYVLDASGHTALEWTVEDEESLALARSRFRLLRGEGYVPFERSPNEDSIRRGSMEFDPHAAEVIWLRPIVGG